MSTFKTEMATSNIELDAQTLVFRSKARLYRTADSIRVALTALALAAAVTILGLSAHTLAVYRRTHLPAEFMLPLWPENFDLRPTTALIACSAVVVVASGVSLLASKTQSLRNRASIHTAVSLAAPLVGFVAALVAMSLYYGANTSETADTMQSWTCRWENVGMLMEPHFGSLCQQSEAGLVLAILLVPIEVIVLAVAGYQGVLEKKLDFTSRQAGSERGSPALS